MDDPLSLAAKPLPVKWVMGLTDMFMQYLILLVGLMDPIIPSASAISQGSGCQFFLLVIVKHYIQPKHEMEST